jgi:hypothetical protein
MNPENHIAKTELCRLAYSLLSDEVKLIVANEMNLSENNHPKHEVNIAEMIVLHSIFKVTRAARIITKMNSTEYPGHMKNFLVMEVAKAKKCIHRVSQFTPESCVAYLKHPLITSEPRPEIVKKVNKKYIDSLKRVVGTSEHLSYYVNGDGDFDENANATYRFNPPNKRGITSFLIFFLP